MEADIPKLHMTVLGNTGGMSATQSIIVLYPLHAVPGHKRQLQCNES